jgi:hypothetical protein
MMMRALILLVFCWSAGAAAAAAPPPLPDLASDVIGRWSRDQILNALDGFYAKHPCNVTSLALRVRTDPSGDPATIMATNAGKTNYIPKFTLKKCYFDPL